MSLWSWCYAGQGSSLKMYVDFYKWFNDHKTQFQIFMRVIGNQEEQKVSIILNRPLYMIISKINIVFIINAECIFLK